jgi:tRNA pseudouridine55 synthase
VKPSGVLIVDKPRGPTSHDIVAQARRIFGTREVGHAGTLDPMATGVLVLVFGEATKLSNYLTGANKRYLATVQFGIATDTGDAEGQVTEQLSLSPDWLHSQALNVALDGERTRIEQRPPAVSAIHVAGRRAHELARSGSPPDLPPRPVTVHQLELRQHDENTATVELEVSKGYYVRAFARDLGAALGVPACLTQLRRLSSGAFHVDRASGWPAPVDAPLISLPEAAAQSLPVAVLTPEGVRRARFGQGLALDCFEAPPTEPLVAAWMNEAGELVAIGERRGEGFAVVRGFRSESC